MTMGDETPVTSLVLPVLIRPILSQLERRDVAASQTLRAALSKVEAAHPGFTYDLVVGIMRRGDLSINMNESVLRLQGSTSEADGIYVVAIFSLEIASAIKKLLDAVNEVAGFIPGSTGKQALEQRKREFVKANAVFVSALYLIHQTNMIMVTVKSKCE
ncbi:Programmed cell death protein 10-A [Blattella germanica]|nr:Programmed cell death protein 10-A [Blattella germanica]